VSVRATLVLHTSATRTPQLFVRKSERNALQEMGRQACNPGWAACVSGAVAGTPLAQKKRGQQRSGHPRMDWAV